jgi:hypothetical protein
VCREGAAGVASADLGVGVMTTNPERKKRSVEPAVTVERLVRAQLRAMGCARFDLGVRRDGGEMVLREGQGAFAVAEAVNWLRHENAKGAHVGCCESFIGDGGGPPGVGLQEQAPNRHKLRG